MATSFILFRYRGQKFALVWVFSLFCFNVFAQQIYWAKTYPLAKSDEVLCITQDEEGFMYAAGRTFRNGLTQGGTNYARPMLIKLDTEGDTVYVKDFGLEGRISSIAIDPYGMIRANIVQSLYRNGAYHTIFVTMTPNGFILNADTVNRMIGANSCIIGKDSSLILAGFMLKPGGGFSMYFLRIQKDGTKDPIVELNPGHPNCVANRVEQLPNGHYLVSGYVGSRIASYELDEWGLTYTFKQWYQTPDFSNMNSGHVSRINGQRYMIGGEGGPSIVGQYDSLLNKYWLRKDVGTQIPPQAMTDGSVVFGYRSSVPPYQSFYRINADSQHVWNMGMRDSLLARGMPGNLTLTCFTYYEDQSAVVAGRYRWDGTGTTNTQEDPIFLHIANIGTPVTSLYKPKPGPLKNETLAPWPNPTGGKLYLKQHFNQAEIRLYNLAGKEVGQYQIRFGQPIEISHLETGVYLYRAMIDGKGFSGKVIKAP